MPLVAKNAAFIEILPNTANSVPYLIGKNPSLAAIFARACRQCDRLTALLAAKMPMSYNEPYQSYPAQRTKTVLIVESELAPLVRRRPIEVLRGIDMRGDWLFGLELRQVNHLTLAKVRALAPDGTTIAIAACALTEWPSSMELRHFIQALGDSELGVLSVKFNGPAILNEEALELDTVPFKLMEFRSYAPEGRELIAPWVTLALTA